MALERLLTPVRILRSEFITDGCILDLKTDEGEGTTARDSSGYGNHGSITGAIWVDGYYGKALSFDGVDDYVEVPHSDSLYLDADFTVLAWVALERTPPAWYGVIDKGRITKNDFWFLSIKDYNQFLFGIGFTDDTFTEQKFPEVTLGSWNFYAFGVEGSNMFVSLNGAAKTYESFTKTRNIATQQLTFGCYNTIRLFEKIRLGKVHIHNRGLPAAELSKHFYQKRHLFGI